MRLLKEKKSPILEEKTQKGVEVRSLSSHDQTEHDRNERKEKGRCAQSRRRERSLTANTVTAAEEEHEAGAGTDKQKRAWAVEADCRGNHAALALTSCVTLNKLLNLPVPILLNLKVGMMMVMKESAS